MGGKGSCAHFPPTRRVGKGVGGLYQEGWEREFLPMGCVKRGLAAHGVKKGGKGSSCPWGVSRRVGKGFPTHGGKKGGKGSLLPMGCVKKGGKGSSCPWGVSRRVGKGVPAHGVCQEGWEREFAHGVCEEGWEREFPPMGWEEGWERELPTGCVKSKKKPQPLWNGWGFF